MKRKSTEDFIMESNLKHKNKYGYNKTIYKDAKTNVIISCPLHGDFEQMPTHHLKGSGCRICKGNEPRNLNWLINEGNKIHGNKYDYKRFKFINVDNKSKIICPIHGLFYKTPYKHINRKQGCPTCSRIEKNKSQFISDKEFLKRAKETHGDDYSYNMKTYTNIKSKLEITCNKGHMFKQKAEDHVNGRGCPICKESKGEARIRRYLEASKIKFIREYKLGDTRFRYDFYLPEHNLLIEYDGEQHFMIKDVFGGKKGFLKTKARDKMKNILAYNHSYNLLRIKFTDFDRIEKILKYKLKLT